MTISISLNKVMIIYRISSRIDSDKDNFGGTDGSTTDDHNWSNFRVGSWHHVAVVRNGQTVGIFKWSCIQEQLYWNDDW